MNFLRRLPTLGAAAAACALVVTACGGGGSEPVPALGGVIRGLQPGSSDGSPTLVLSVAGAEQSFTASAYGALAFRFAADIGLVNGQRYDVAVSRHPLGQLCVIRQGASVVVQGPVDAVVVECHTTILNDTGLADGGPDGQQGRDAEARAGRLTKLGSGQQGFDYTRLCSSGRPVVNGGCSTDVVNGQPDRWACTRDNVTGLVWQLEAGPGQAAPPAEWCGLNGWRKPSVHELLSIVHAGAGAAGGAAVDADFFPATPAADFAAGESYLEPATGLPDGGVWAVGFGSGGGYAGKNTDPASLAVRWVAGNSRVNDPAETQTDAYACSVPGDDYLIVDSRRGLTWAIPRDAQPLDWNAAVASVAAVNLRQPGGHADWRLPNRSELDSLAMRGRTSPAVHPALRACPLDRFSTVFWSSSTAGALAAWTVSFEDGSISMMARGTPARVLYVRDRVIDGP